MKKKIILFALLIAGLNFGASGQPKGPLRTVDVMGSAEKEVVPDELYVGITLQEYLKTPNKYASVVKMNAIEETLRNAVAKAGLSPESITVSNMSQFKYDDAKDNRVNEFLMRKQYIIKMESIARAQQIVSMLDPKSVYGTYVERAAHSQIKTYQRELQVAAFNDARETAINIARAAGMTLGKVVKVVSTMNNSDGGAMPLGLVRLSSTGANEGSSLSFRKIKIRYEERVVFELL